LYRTESPDAGIQMPMPSYACFKTVSTFYLLYCPTLAPSPILVKSRGNQRGRLPTLFHPDGLKPSPAWPYSPAACPACYAIFSSPSHVRSSLEPCSRIQPGLLSLSELTKQSGLNLVICHFLRILYHISIVCNKKRGVLSGSS
jgi:hypothetical protein